MGNRGLVEVSACLRNQRSQLKLAEIPDSWYGAYQGFVFPVRSLFRFASYAHFFLLKRSLTGTYLPRVSSKRR